MLAQPTLDGELFPEVEDHRRYIGACPVRGCKSPPRSAAAPEPVACQQHHRSYRWQPVEGTHKPGIKCNADCQYARRNVCECSCAGRNHGRGWMA